MNSYLKIIFSIITVTEFIIGNMSNGFIVLINCIDFVNRRKLSLVDQILVILAMSRIGLVWEIFVSWFQCLDASFPLMPEKDIKILIFIWIITNHFNLWLATVLSIFYLLKIASFSWSIFLYLKWRIRKIVLIILVGTLVFLSLNLMNTGMILEDRIHQHGRNGTWDSRVSNLTSFSELATYNMTMFSITPFSMAMLSFLLLIFSLWKHLQKMQVNAEGHRDPSTKAHINALKMMVSFLLLYAIYFLSLLISWISQRHMSQLAHILCMITGLTYPSIHSFALILGNSKLRKIFLLLLKQLNCRLKGEKGTTP